MGLLARQTINCERISVGVGRLAEEEEEGEDAGGHAGGGPAEYYRAYFSSGLSRAPFRACF